MNINEQRFALRFGVDFKATSGLLLRSGRAGEFSDAALETSGDGRLHINGYVWASLLRRALARCESGLEFAAAWGKYRADDFGISPLWTEAAFLDPKDYLVAVNPGNRIDRQWGSVAEGALYSEDLAFPRAGLPCRGTVFCASWNEAEKAREALADAIWVIGRGIETIGGGWSYGFGRLRGETLAWEILDLHKHENRQRLWGDWDIPPAAETDETAGTISIVERRPSIASGRGWTAFEVKAQVMPGQLLAIHNDVPGLGVEIDSYPVLPDHFVFTRPRFAGNKVTARPVVTGKAFRQAVLSREIERRLRSSGKDVCLDSSDPGREPKVVDPNEKRHCGCRRCLWFGDADAGGIIAVADAPVEGAERVVVNRIQVCEHSRQTMHDKLFNGEYLAAGKFVFELLIDHSRKNETASRELAEQVAGLLEELRPAAGRAPAGWHRLGATSTCTGQIEVVEVESCEYKNPSKEPGDEK